MRLKLLINFVLYFFSPPYAVSSLGTNALLGERSQCERPCEYLVEWLRVRESVAQKLVTAIVITFLSSCFTICSRNSQYRSRPIRIRHNAVRNETTLSLTQFIRKIILCLHSRMPAHWWQYQYHSTFFWNHDIGFCRI